MSTQYRRTLVLEHAAERFDRPRGRRIPVVAGDQRAADAERFRHRQRKAELRLGIPLPALARHDAVADVPAERQQGIVEPVADVDAAEDLRLRVVDEEQQRGGHEVRRHDRAHPDRIRKPRLVVAALRVGRGGRDLRIAPVRQISFKHFLAHPFGQQQLHVPFPAFHT